MNTPQVSPSLISGYDLENPVIIHLKSTLDEISGIAYYAKDSSLFAINDEQGIIYKIMMDEKIKINQWKFSDSGDFEDLVLVNDIFYVLQSNGNIHAIRFFGKDSVRVQLYEIPLNGINNFETLYFDSQANQLVLLCKNCAGSGKQQSPAYGFQLSDHSFSTLPLFSIDHAAISSMLQQENVKFKPSAAAIHPLTGQLFILSSVEKILCITGIDGKVSLTTRLPEKFFKQPEGITFSPRGDLYISNESAEVGSSNVLVYRYKN